VSESSHSLRSAVGPQAGRGKIADGAVMPPSPVKNKGLRRATFSAAASKNGLGRDRFVGRLHFSRCQAACQAPAGRHEQTTLAEAEPAESGSAQCSLIKEVVCIALDN